MSTFDSSACWEVPGFKNCNTEAGADAFRWCQKHSADVIGGDWSKSIYSSFEDCRKKQNAKNFDECVIKYECSQVALAQKAKVAAVSITKRSISDVSDLKNLPWGTYSFATKTYQYDANDILKLLGKKQVSTDGKLGPATCLGFHYVHKSGKISNWVMPLACAGRYAAPSSTPPAQSIAPPPTKQAFTEAEPSSTEEYQPPLSAGRKVAIVAGGAAFLFAGLWLWKNRG